MPKSKVAKIGREKKKTKAKNFIKPITTAIGIAINTVGGRTSSEGLTPKEGSDERLLEDGKITKDEYIRRKKAKKLPSGTGETGHKVASKPGKTMTNKAKLPKIYRG